MMRPAVRRTVTILAILALSACADAPPNAPLGHGPRGDHPSFSYNDAGGSTGGLLSCTPLPYDSVTQTVGPAGGTIQVGPHELWIPQDALSSSVAITAVVPSTSTNQIQFAPHGLQFSRNTYLLMSYANCELPDAERWVAYTDGGSGIVEYLAGLDDPYAFQVLGWLTHFSNYAVAW
jgi:hypothetical protein